MHIVRQVLRKDMGLKYKRCTKLTHRGNDERNLVLRQQFALRLLELMKQKKRILNVDETWISGFKNIICKWRAPGTSNGVPSKQV